MQDLIEIPQEPHVTYSLGDKTAAGGYTDIIETTVGASVIGKVCPLGTEIFLHELPPDITIEDMFEYFDLTPEAVDKYVAGIRIGGAVIPRSMWKHTTPKKNMVVEMSMQLHGDAEDTLISIIAAVLVVASAAYFGPIIANFFAVAATSYVTLALIDAVVATVTSIAINSLLSPGEGGTSINAPKSIFALTGFSNNYNHYGALPRVFGRHRIFPVIAANTYSFIKGNDQYLRTIMTAGYGPGEISDLKLGNTPIENFEGVKYETRGTPGSFLSIDTGVLIEGASWGGIFSRFIAGLDLPTTLPTTPATHSYSFSCYAKANSVISFGRLWYLEIGDASPKFESYAPGFRTRYTRILQPALSIGRYPNIEITPLTAFPLRVPDDWVHILAEGDSHGGVKIYFDGILIIDMPTALAPAPAPVQDLFDATWYPVRDTNNFYNNNPTENYLRLKRGSFDQVLVTREKFTEVQKRAFVRRSATTDIEDMDFDLRWEFDDVPVDANNILHYPHNGDLTSYNKGGNISAVVGGDTLDDRSIITYMPGGPAKKTYPHILYHRDVEQQNFNVKLTGPAVPVIRTTTQKADEIEIGLILPKGLTSINAEGEKFVTGSRYKIRYRKIDPEGGDTQWIFVNATTPGLKHVGINPLTNSTWFLQNNTPDLIRVSVGWNIDNRYQYEVELTILNPGEARGPAQAKLINDTRWVALRTFRNVSPINIQGLVTIAFEIKASEQLNSTVNNLNFIFAAHHPFIYGKVSVANAIGVVSSEDLPRWIYKPSRNPAHHCLGVLMGEATVEPIGLERIDIQSFLDWIEYNDTQKFTSDYINEGLTTTFAIFNVLAANGRSSLDIRDGKYSIVTDKAGKLALQHFGPRNSWGFAGIKSFIKAPHALRVQFINPDNPTAPWVEDERIVYGDGYSESNAVDIEIIKLLGITNSDLAWKHGRFYLAILSTRQEKFVIHVDIEYLVAQRGDKILLSHDVALIGLGGARITSVVTIPGGTNTSLDYEIHLDTEMDFISGKTYQLQERNHLVSGDGVRLEHGTYTIEGIAGPANVVRINAPAAVPTEGSLVYIGEVDSVSLECIVDTIEPSGDLTAKLTLIPYSSQIFNADKGPIPPYNPIITTNNAVHNLYSPIITLDNTSGTFSVLVNFIPISPSSDLPLGAHAEIQYRRRALSNENAWTNTTEQSSTTGNFTLVIDSTSGDYEFRGRYTYLGSAGIWSIPVSVLLAFKAPGVPNNLRYSNRTLNWDLPVIPNSMFAKFEVRRSVGTLQTREASRAAFVDFTVNTYYSPDFRLQPETYFVRALGAQGSNSSWSSIVLPAEPMPFHVYVYSFETLVGNGNISNTEYTRGKLYGSGLGDNFWVPLRAHNTAVEAILFWEGTSYFWEEKFNSIVFYPHAEYLGPNLGVLVSNTSEAGTSQVVNYIGASAISTARHLVTFRAVTVLGGRAQPVLSSYVGYVGAAQQVETIENVAIAAGGTQITLKTKFFDLLHFVSATIVGGSAAVRVTTTTALPSPTIVCYNAEDVSVAATVDIYISGSLR